MLRQNRRLIKRSIIISAAAVGIIYGVGSLNGVHVDRYSYERGFDAFGGAYLPPDVGNRAQIEDQCDAMLRERSLAAPAFELVREDWIAGCADAAQGKDPYIED